MYQWTVLQCIFLHFCEEHMTIVIAFRLPSVGSFSWPTWPPSTPASTLEFRSKCGSPNCWGVPKIYDPAATLSLAWCTPTPIWVQPVQNWFRLYEKCKHRRSQLPQERMPTHSSNTTTTCTSNSTHTSMPLSTLKHRHAIEYNSLIWT